MMRSLSLQKWSKYVRKNVLKIWLEYNPIGNPFLPGTSNIMRLRISRVRGHLIFFLMSANSLTLLMLGKYLLTSILKQNFVPSGSLCMSSLIWRLHLCRPLPLIAA